MKTIRGCNFAIWAAKAGRRALANIIDDLLKACGTPITGRIEPKTQKIIKDWRQKEVNAEEIEAAYAGRELG